MDRHSADSKQMSISEMLRKELGNEALINEPIESKMIHQHENSPGFMRNNFCSRDMDMINFPGHKHVDRQPIQETFMGVKNITKENFIHPSRSSMYSSPVQHMQSSSSEFRAAYSPYVQSNSPVVASSINNTTNSLRRSIGHSSAFYANYNSQSPSSNKSATNMLSYASPNNRPSMISSTILHKKPHPMQPNTNNTPMPESSGRLWTPLLPRHQPTPQQTSSLPPHPQISSHLHIPPAPCPPPQLPCPPQQVPRPQPQVPPLPVPPPLPHVPPPPPQVPPPPPQEPPPPPQEPPPPPQEPPPPLPVPPPPLPVPPPAASNYKSSALKHVKEHKLVMKVRSRTMKEPPAQQHSNILDNRDNESKRVFKAPQKDLITSVRLGENEALPDLYSKLRKLNEELAMIKTKNDSNSDSDMEDDTDVSQRTVMSNKLDGTLVSDDNSERPNLDARIKMLIGVSPLKDRKLSRTSSSSENNVPSNLKQAMSTPENTTSSVLHGNPTPVPPSNTRDRTEIFPRESKISLVGSSSFKTISTANNNNSGSSYRSNSIINQDNSHIMSRKDYITSKSVNGVIFNSAEAISHAPTSTLDVRAKNPKNLDEIDSKLSRNVMDIPNKSCKDFVGIDHKIKKPTDLSDIGHSKSNNEAWNCVNTGGKLHDYNGHADMLNISTASNSNNESINRSNSSAAVGTIEYNVTRNYRLENTNETTDGSGSVLKSGVNVDKLVNDKSSFVKDTADLPRDIPTMSSTDLRGRSPNKSLQPVARVPSPFLSKKIYNYWRKESLKFKKQRKKLPMGYINPNLRYEFDSSSVAEQKLRMSGSASGLSSNRDMRGISGEQNVEDLEDIEFQLKRLEEINRQLQELEEEEDEEEEEESDDSIDVKKEEPHKIEMVETIANNNNVSNIAESSKISQNTDCTKRKRTFDEVSDVNNELITLVMNSIMDELKEDIKCYIQDNLIANKIEQYQSYPSKKQKVDQ